MISTQPEEQKRRDFIRPSWQFGDVKLGLILMASFCNFYAGEDNTQASVRLLESHCSKLWLERWQLGDVKLELILVASFCNFYPRKFHQGYQNHIAPSCDCSSDHGKYKFIFKYIIFVMNTWNLSTEDCLPCHFFCKLS